MSASNFITRIMFSSSTKPSNSSPLVNEIHPDQIPTESAAISCGSSPEEPKPIAAASDLEYPEDPTAVDLLVKEMTSHIQHGRVKDMVLLFILFCRPGDWKSEKTPQFRHHLIGYYENDINPLLERWFSEIIQFEWEAALFTDQLVGLFELPLPNDQICIIWKSGVRGRESVWNSNWLEDSMCMNLYENFHLPCQFRSFWRPQAYLTAAILKTKKSSSEINELIASIGNFIQQVRTFVPGSPDNENIPDWVQEWLATDAGRKANVRLRSLHIQPVVLY